MDEAIRLQSERDTDILTDGALEFVARLHRSYDSTRKDLLAARDKRQQDLVSGELPTFPEETSDVRSGDWKVAPPPEDLMNRRVEITGPTDRKMMINALNSGAQVFMADFEDSNAPTWSNLVIGHRNLIDAIERNIDFTSPEGKAYELNDEVATLVLRPRGWHLDERHLEVDGEPVAGALFDYGLYMFHCTRRLIERGSGPYFYLPKLEGYKEARLWREIFDATEDEFGLERGTIKCTVLVETILAAFEMEEILYELREHSCALNAGRWDYIFSIIKRFRHREDWILPDRIEVTMTVPFMRAYTELLVSTCHRRDAQALGGMAAFIPSRKDPEVNEKALAKVREDKERESTDGFDGTWVAHPDLVPVAFEVFDDVLGDKANQVDRKRDDVDVKPADLLDVRVPGGKVTDQGLRNNISVGLQYIESWLRGTGAAAIFNLMEDAATAEIARAQVWQWLHHGTVLDNGTKVTKELVEQLEAEELGKVRDAIGADAYESSRFKEAQEIFEQVALSDDFVEFLTLPAYAYLD